VDRVTKRDQQPKASLVVDARLNINNVRDRDELALEVARRYYLDNETTPELAEAFNVSRSTISRLIASAREHGWVKIEVANPNAQHDGHTRFLKERFGLRTLLSVPARRDIDMTDIVARRAAALICQNMTNHRTIGVAWGVTMAAVASYITPLDLVGCTVVQLNGAGSQRDLQVDYSLQILHQFSGCLNASAIVFPVPAFFDNAKTRDALWMERSIDSVRKVQMSCNVALFSIGSMNANRLSRVWADQYLDATDRSHLVKDRAAGDIATYFFDADGNSEGIRLNHRASGLPIDRLRDIEEKYCVVAGVGKANALAGALRGGYVNHLVADSALLEVVADLCRHD
jgi:deoxyribonucleoside regulator